MSSLEDSVNSAFSPLTSTLEDLEKATDVLETRNMGDLELAPLEEAKLSVALAYSAASLFYMLQNASGQDASKHPINTSELAGVKQYVGQLKKVEQEATKEEK